VRFTLRDGDFEAEILGREHFVDFYSEELLIAFLQRFLADPVNRGALRQALAEERGGANLSRLDDLELLRPLARRMLSGDLKIVVRRHGSRPGAAAPEAAAAQEPTPREAEAAAREESPAAAPAPASTAAAAATSASAVEDPLLPPGLDPVAQAATLQAAAESGAPLCDT
jgi:hypothetical protein